MKTVVDPPDVSKKASQSALSWVVIGAVSLAGGVSAALAAMAALLMVLDPAVPGWDDGSIDLCGNPLTGFWAFWDQFGWVCLLGVAVLLIAAAVAMVYYLAMGRRGVATVLVLVTLCLCPIPWTVQIGRQSDEPGCHQL